MTMANKSTRRLLLLAICAVLFVAGFMSTVDAGGGEIYHQLGWIATGSAGGCRGTVAECLSTDEEEFGMSSEISRRILAIRRRYISYGALARNRVPCSRRGASYYNCRPGARANPYSRGCSAIARCRR